MICDQKACEHRPEPTREPNDAPKLVFFIEGEEALGNACFGSDLDWMLKLLRDTIASTIADGQGEELRLTITAQLMTDAEVNALPEL